jgi:hypothetical protein
LQTFELQAFELLAIERFDGGIEDRHALPE